jgi:cytochrome P450
MPTFAVDADRTAANLAANRLPRFDLAMDHAVDPYPRYAEYRAHDPVHWGLPSDPRLPGLWYLFRHADCSALFRCSVESPDALGATPGELGWDFGAGAPAATQSYFTLRKSFLTAMNDPDHARVRNVIAGFFTPRRVAGFRPRLERIVGGLCDEIEAAAAADGGRFDFGELLAHRLPLIVMSELMGVPPEDREVVLGLSDRLMQGFDVDGTFDRVLVAAEGAEGFAGYLDGLFAKRRNGTVDDVIAAIVRAADEDRMSEPELYGTVSTLLQAGQSPAMGLLGIGTLGLLHQRDRFAELAADPALVVPATEELLRWASPAQAPPPRWIYSDVTIGGRLLRRGEAAVALIGAANHDPSVFADPERIDFHRSPNPHLAFGGGIHRCLGSTLARLEGQVVFTELVRRFPTLDVDTGGAAQYQDRHIARALVRLPLVLR